VALVALTGCTTGETIGRLAATSQWRTDGFDGARVAASGGGRGVQVGLGLFWDELARPMDPDHHASGGLELNSRVSLFGLFADNHTLEHYFDLGFEGGAGGGFAHPASLESFGELWGGGFVDLALGSMSSPALELGVHEVTYSGPWNTETVFTIGFAWVNRSAQSFGLMY